LRRFHLRAATGFANVWQIPFDFAKHWQNVSRARRMDLPMFGKFAWFLPNIGKSRKTAAQSLFPPLAETIRQCRRRQMRNV
jgi:hypothetical protein